MNAAGTSRPGRSLQAPRLSPTLAESRDRRSSPRRKRRSGHRPASAHRRVGARRWPVGMCLPSGPRLGRGRTGGGIGHPLAGTAVHFPNRVFPHCRGPGQARDGTSRRGGLLFSAMRRPGPRVAGRGRFFGAAAPAFGRGKAPGGPPLIQEGPWFRGDRTARFPRSSGFRACALPARSGAEALPKRPGAATHHLNRRSEKSFRHGLRHPVGPRMGLLPQLLRPRLLWARRNGVPHSPGRRPDRFAGAPGHPRSGPREHEGVEAASATSPVAHGRARCLGTSQHGSAGRFAPAGQGAARSRDRGHGVTVPAAPDAWCCVNVPSAGLNARRLWRQGACLRPAG
jgi:hypothetical protein